MGGYSGCIIQPNFFFFLIHIPLTLFRMIYTEHYKTYDF